MKLSGIFFPLVSKNVLSPERVLILLNIILNTEKLKVNGLSSFFHYDMSKEC